MKKRLVTGSLVFLLVLNLVFGMRWFTVHAETESKKDDAYANIALLTRALLMIRQDYVDGDKVSYKDLTYHALKGMLQSLDPHSQFMEPASFEDMQEDTKSQFGGLGVEVSTRDGLLTIVSPMEGTPAAKAGVMSGDQIVRIDNVMTEKLDPTDAITKLRGEPGTKVTITILRPSTKEVKDFTIVRDFIKVESVRGTELIDSPATGGYKIGYLRITQFSEPTATELGKRLDELQGKGMDALILDLRNNPGGLLNSAVDVCGQFVPPNTMVVYTKGRTQSSQREYRTHAMSKGKLRPDFPMVVLINGGSASAAEIVSGALKDLGRAVIVGETSFGKGSVQSVLPLPDGSAVRLTTAKYFTPGKQVIHEVGVTPNIKAVMSPEQERAMVWRRTYESLTDEQKKDADRLRDTQMDRAIDALKGILIYNKKSDAPEAAAEKTTP